MSRVTDIAARFAAGSLAVCREGAVVALHIGTPQGEVVVTMGELDFVRAARGPRDHNGNLFRSLDQIDVETRHAAEATTPLSVAAPRKPMVPRGTNADKYAAVQRAKDAGSHLTYGALCAQIGVPIGSFYGWRSTHGLARAPRATAAPKL